MLNETNSETDELLNEKHGQNKCCSFWSKNKFNLCMQNAFKTNLLYKTRIQCKFIWSNNGRRPLIQCTNSSSRLNSKYIIASPNDIKYVKIRMLFSLSLSLPFSFIENATKWPCRHFQQIIKRNTRSATAISRLTLGSHQLVMRH